MLLRAMWLFRAVPDKNVIPMDALKAKLCAEGRFMSLHFSCFAENNNLKGVS